MSDIRLNDLRQWLPFTTIRRENGKIGKPPVDHRTGKIGNGLDRGAWMTYTEARAYAAAHRLPGVGFMPTADDPFGVIDLDGCLTGGKLSPLAAEIMSKIDTYAEVTYSGNGLHVWAKTDLKINLERQSQGVEVYTHDQFMVWTGKRWPQAPNKIAHADLGWLIERYQGDQKPPIPPPVAINATPTTDDAKLWALIWRVDRTGRVERLYNGDLSTVGGDHSGGVIVLLNTLAKFTNGDRQRMRRMIEQTALTNDKWSSRRGDGDWLKWRIENACRYSGYL